LDACAETANQPSLEYTALMDMTLTIHTDEKLHEALQERAAMQGKTIPELAREILSEAVAERSMAERVGHLRGQLHLHDDASDPWRAHLRESNFRS
jgi:plasmid stability protein